MKKITIENVTYKSFAAAWRALAVEGVSRALARKRVSRGWDPELALKTPPVPPQARRAGVQT